MKKSLTLTLALVTLGLVTMIGPMPKPTEAIAHRREAPPAQLPSRPKLACCTCVGGVAELDLSTGQGGPIDSIWRRTPGGPAYVTPAYGGWTTSLPEPARWIQPVASPTPADIIAGGLYRYTVDFEVAECAIPSVVRLTVIGWAVDNSANVFLDNTQKVAECKVNKCFVAGAAQPFTIPSIGPGSHSLRFDVTNQQGQGTPSGLIVSARLTRKCARDADTSLGTGPNWGVQTGRFIEASPTPSPTPSPTSSPTPSPQPSPVFEVRDNYGFISMSSRGLNTHVISFPSGSRYVVNLPEDIAAGDTFSGTVQPELAGTDPKQRARNQAEFDKAQLLIGGQPIRGAENVFTRTIQTEYRFDEPFIVLKVKEKTVVSVKLPIPQTPVLPRATFQLPACGQMGRNIVVMHPGDGIIDGRDSSYLGTAQLQFLAESPRMRVMRNNFEVAGLTEIKYSEQDYQTSGPFMNVGVHLTSPNTNLLKGQTTTLDLVVSAPGLQHDLSLDLTNDTPGIVTLSGGALQHFTIHPADIQVDGTYRKGFTVSSNSVGAWGATAIVTCIDP